MTIKPNSKDAINRVSTDNKKLPDGWEWKKLWEVCDIKGGGTPSKSNKAFYDGNIPWATVRDMQSNVLSKTEYKISKEAVRKSATNIIKSGNVIIATRVGLGKACIIESDTAINQDLKGIIPKSENEVDKLYLFQWFKSVASEIIKNGTGATVQGVKIPFIESLLIPLPPLSEQKRIVAILDEAFAAIDKAKANAEKNLANAKELFESYLNGIFANPGEDWEEKKLGEVCEVIGGGTPSKKIKEYYNGNIPWATVRDMQGDIIQKTECKITEEAVKKSSTNIIPKNNIIIATRVGLGKVCMLHKDTAINQDLRGIIPKNSNHLNVPFLFRYFKSISNKIIEEGTGATVKGVKLPFIKGLAIPLPPLSEQQSIIHQLDILSANTYNLKSIYQKKINTLEELKKSILKKAFEGEL